MREILFRGKDVKGHWNIGLLAHIGNAWYISNKAGVATAFEAIPSTIGQYTGLTDKNGTKIFEGDIVDILTENEEIGFIAYDEGGFLVNADGFCVTFQENINGTDVEVIGNIYDNPELLQYADNDTAQSGLMPAT